MRFYRRRTEKKPPQTFHHRRVRVLIQPVSDQGVPSEGGKTIQLEDTSVEEVVNMVGKAVKMEESSGDAEAKD